jgi:hypothetical protein
LFQNWVWLIGWLYDILQSIILLRCKVSSPNSMGWVCWIISLVPLTTTFQSQFLWIYFLTLGELLFLLHNVSTKTYLGRPKVMTSLLRHEPNVCLFPKFFFWSSNPYYDYIWDRDSEKVIKAKRGQKSTSPNLIGSLSIRGRDKGASSSTSTMGKQNKKLTICNPRREFSPGMDLLPLWS